MKAYAWLRLDTTVVGGKFGSRMAIGPAFTVRNSAGLCRKMVVLECECGETSVQEISNARKNSRCRECFAREGRCGVLTHGHTRGHCPTPEYVAWGNMLKRCYSPKDRKFQSYGARGIRVADEWRGPGGFDQFIAHLGRRPSDAHSLDRIDNDKNYEPGNVRWATRKEQQRNTRQNKSLTINGVTMLQIEWAEKCGLTPQTISWRIKRGLAGEAIIAPSRCDGVNRKSPTRRTAMTVN